MSRYAMISMNYIGYYLPIQFNLLSRERWNGKKSKRAIENINKKIEKRR